jgi:hypothetical protein
MFLTILGFITGLAGPIRDIAGKIADLKIAQVQASTDQDRVRVQAEIDEARARQAVLTAEAGSRLNAIIRGGLAFGPCVYLLKVFVWDKVLGSFLGHAKGGSMFVTDPLDNNLWKVVVAVIAFYFVYDMAARFRR